MKKCIIGFSICVIFQIHNLHAQTGVGISNIAITPDPSSILEIRSTEKGFLIPRLTEIQRNAILSPATGLLIYQTTGESGFYYFNGLNWTPLLNENSGWKLNGNSISSSWNGTAGSFIGTTSLQPLIIGTMNASAQDIRFFSGNTERMRISGSGNIGIQTTTPGSALDIKGTLRLSGSTNGFVGFTPAANAGSTTYTLPSNDGTSGQVLQTNGSGVLSWITPPGASGGWSLTGNAGTNGNGVLGGISTGSEIGTTDAASLSIVTSNIVRAIVNATGTISVDKDMLINSLTLGKGGGNRADNMALGFEAMLGGGNNAPRNTAIGYQTLKANTGGSDNVGVGYQTLLINNSGYNNTAVGSQALQDNTTGIANTGLGYWTLRDNTTGVNNTAVGSQVLPVNIGGSNNTSLGALSLWNNTTGSNNIAIGYQAGYYSINATDKFYISSTPNNPLMYGELVLGRLMLNGTLTTMIPNPVLTAALQVNVRTLGDKGVIVRSNGSTEDMLEVQDGGGVEVARIESTGNASFAGVYVGRGGGNRADNMAVGFEAIFGNAAAAPKNTAIGYQALKSLSGGSENVGVGFQSLTTNTSGSFNSALGAFALQSNINGSHNVALGNSSLKTNTSGVYNTSVGHSAGFSNTAGSNNTSLGYQSLYQVTSGNNNVAIGFNAGSLANGSNKLFIANASSSSAIYGEFDAGRIGINTNHTAIVPFPTLSAALSINVKTVTDKGIVVKGGGNHLIELQNSGSAPMFTVDEFGNTSISNSAELRLMEPTVNGTNYTAFKAGSQSSNVTYTLPNSAPLAANTGNQLGSAILESNNSGVLSWRQMVVVTANNFDLPITNPQVSSEGTVAVTGAAPGDIVSLGIPPGAIIQNTTYTAWVSANDVVTIRFTNYSNVAQNPPNSTFKVSVIK
jgi:hypothetical protein